MIQAKLLKFISDNSNNIPKELLNNIPKEVLDNFFGADMLGLNTKDKRATDDGTLFKIPIYYIE